MPEPHDHIQVPAPLDVREDAIPDFLVTKIMSLRLPEDVHFVESDRHLQIMRVRFEEKGNVGGSCGPRKEVQNFDDVRPGSSVH